MKAHYEAAGVTLFHGDCLDVLRELPDESVHAVVTDPPYGLGFMGQKWDTYANETGRRPSTKDHKFDHVGGNHNPSNGADAARTRRVEDQRFGLWCEQWAAECLRVLKPGGHLLAFGGSRTWHRLAAGIEDAGFEIRDSIAWLYGSGFPKSMDVAKAITGHESGHGSNSGAIRRAIMGDEYTPSDRLGNRDGAGRRDTGLAGREMELSENGARWSGWGTALKPAFEPIVVARKPLAGTVAANVLAHGTGALNIDASRVQMSSGDREAARVPMRAASPAKAGTPAERAAENFAPADGGRWPANVALDESQAGVLDEQAPDTGGAGKASGPSRTGESKSPARGMFAGTAGVAPFYDDRGGASRMFPTFHYQAKAPQSERPVVDGVEHPTVKPLDLMRWLVRLVTPKGGTVLEPFAGSGTTVEACLREGFDVIAIEREAAYLPLIEKRIRKDHAQGLDFDWDGAA